MKSSVDLLKESDDEFLIETYKSTIESMRKDLKSIKKCSKSLKKNYYYMRSAMDNSDIDNKIMDKQIEEAIKNLVKKIMESDSLLKKLLRIISNEKDIKKISIEYRNCMEKLNPIYELLDEIGAVYILTFQRRYL